MFSAELLKEWRSGAFTSSTNEPALLTMPIDIMTPMNAPTPEVAVKFVRQQKKEGVDFIKIGGILPVVFNAVQAEANKLNISVEGHVLSDMDLKEYQRRKLVFCIRNYS